MASTIQTVGPAALVAELETAWAEMAGEAVLAFDGDGTLWRGDLGETLFEALLGCSGVRDAAREALRVEANTFDIVSSDDSANGLAQTLLHAFEQQRYPEDRAFAMMAWAFAGWHEDELRSFTARVLDAFGFAEARRRALSPVLAWAAERGLAVWIVSASPLCAVHEAAKRMQLAPARILAMEPELSDGVLQPRLGAAATYGEGKLVRLRAAIGEAPILAAFGDSGWDAVMLRAAHVPVAVSPAASLRAQLPSIPGIRQLGEE